MNSRIKCHDLCFATLTRTGDYALLSSCSFCAVSVFACAASRSVWFLVLWLLVVSSFLWMKCKLLIKHIIKNCWLCFFVCECQIRLVRSGQHFWDYRLICPKFVSLSSSLGITVLTSFVYISHLCMNMFLCTYISLCSLCTSVSSPFDCLMGVNSCSA